VRISEQAPSARPRHFAMAQASTATDWEELASQTSKGGSSVG